MQSTLLTENVFLTHIFFSHFQIDCWNLPIRSKVLSRLVAWLFELQQMVFVWDISREMCLQWSRSGSKASIYVIANQFVSANQANLNCHVSWWGKTLHNFVLKQEETTLDNVLSNHFDMKDYSILSVTHSLQHMFVWI